ncbi:MAG: DUF2752 domain-containing protein [Myxococcota bacterium]
MKAPEDMSHAMTASEQAEDKQELSARVAAPGLLSSLLINPISMAFGAVVVVCSFLFPPTGLGIDLCVFKAQTGLPCHGCGLTRSVTNVSHFDLGSAFHYHPFGVVVWALAIFLTAMVLVGPRGRQRVRAFFDRRDRWGRRIYWGLVYSFVGFGFIRLAAAVLVPGWVEGI